MEIKNKNKLYSGITLFTLTISGILIGLFCAGSTNATTIFYNPHRTNNLELDITRIPETNTVQHMEIPQNNPPLNLGVIGNDYTDYEEEEEEEDFLDIDLQQSLSGINTGDQPQIIPNNQQRRVQTKKEKDKKEDEEEEYEEYEEEEEEEWEEDKNKEDFFDNNFDDDPNDDYFRSYSE